MPWINHMHGELLAAEQQLDGHSTNSYELFNDTYKC